MARRIGTRVWQQRIRRSLDAGYVYPSEAVRLLGIDGIDYAQLRRLLTAVRGPGGKPVTGKWLRVTFKDLAGLKVAIDLCGGPERLVPGSRLRFKEFERTCAYLRAAGFTDPVAQVDLQRAGSSIVAALEGVVLRPATGQLVLQSIQDGILRLLEDSGIEPPAALVRQIRRETQKLEHSLGGRRRGRQTTEVPEGARWRPQGSEEAADA